MPEQTDYDEFWGAPRFDEASRAVRIKGNLLAARPRYVRETYGQQALEELIESTPEPAKRHWLQAPLPFSWYPMTEMAELDRRILDGPMRGNVTLMKAFGATIARYDLPTVYKALFRFGTPTFVMKRIGVAFKMNIEGGSARAEVLGPNEVVITVDRPALPRYLCAHGICGWLEAAIDMSGGREASVVHEACRHDGAPADRWRVRWG